MRLICDLSRSGLLVGVVVVWVCVVYGWWHCCTWGVLWLYCIVVGRLWGFAFGFFARCLLLAGWFLSLVVVLLVVGLCLWVCGLVVACVG